VSPRRLYAHPITPRPAGAGPFWKAQFAISGACPQYGQETISTAAWDGQLLYAGGETYDLNGALNGAHCAGSVRALNPLNSAIFWERSLENSHSRAEIICDMSAEPHFHPLRCRAAASGRVSRRGRCLAPSFTRMACWGVEEGNYAIVLYTNGGKRRSLREW
jgi:hypothetical protein